MAAAAEKRIQNLNHKWHDVEATEDVLADILSRLPVDCLLECKLVSKFWNKFWKRVTKGETFIEMQMKRSTDRPVYLVYYHAGDALTSYLMESDGEVIKEINFPIRGSPACCQTLVCSVHGLVGCLNHSNSEIHENENLLPDLEIRVFNPATREARLLPKGTPSEEMPAVGFAFGPHISDYKVYRFFHALGESESLDKDCEVYSSSTGAWRHIGKAPHVPMRSHFVALGFDHVSIDGNAFWFIASEDDLTIPDAILMVDTEERFRTLSLPDEVTMLSYLVVLECRLALIVVDDEYVHIWSLEEDHNEPNWTKRFSGPFEFSVADFIHGVAARNNEILFMTSMPSDLNNHILNLDDGSWKKIPICDFDENDHPGVLAYTASILSCGGRLVPP